VSAVRKTRHIWDKFSKTTETIGGNTLK
jgi:hypothetical protein